MDLNNKGAVSTVLKPFTDYSSPDSTLRFPVSCISEATSTMVPQHPDLEKIFAIHCRERICSSCASDRH